MNHQIVMGVMLGEAVVFGVLAFVMFQKKSAKMALCKKTWGEVVEVITGSEGGQFPVVRYTAMNGEVVTFKSKSGSSHRRFKAGDRIEIVVSRDNPGDAEVVGFFAQWLTPIILGFISFSGLGGAMVAHFFLK